MKDDRFSSKTESEMLFTKDYIFLFLPKTASIAIRQIIREQGFRLRGRHFCIPECFLPRNYFFEQMVIDDYSAVAHHHGSRRHITDNDRLPFRYLSRVKNGRHRKIVSVVREPWERFCSGYNYRYWEQWTHEQKDEARGRFPSFPDWGIDEYYQFSAEFHTKLYHRELGQGAKIRGVGPLSWYFVLFYSSMNLIALLKEEKINNKDVLMKSFLDDTSGVRFLSQQNLQEQLIEFLQNEPRSSFDFSKLTRVNVTTSINNRDEAYFQSVFREKEAFLFEVFDRIFPSE